MFLATSSAPTPLYGVYRRLWNLSPAATSVVFGAYALALLVVLLVLGRLSDHVGRRPVLWSALLVQVVAMMVFATAGGVAGLLVGRVLQGLSTGAGLAAVGAALLEVDAERGGIANSAAPPIGSAVGALAAAILVTVAPAPTRLVYLVLAAVLMVQFVAVFWLQETSPRRPGAVRSLRPRLRVPRRVFPLLAAAMPVLFSMWAMSGLFGALGPALATTLSGSSWPVLGALPITIVGAVAPATAFSTAGLPGRTSLSRGVVFLLAATAVTAVSVVTSQMWVLLAGAVVAGVGFGLGFRGGMDLVLSAIDASDRAGTLSLLYVACYLGFGVPAIAAGVVVQRTGDLNATTLGYSGVLAILAGSAAVALRLTRRRTSHPTGGDRGGANT
jgi:predicted MFS family arabinose efflux permease